MNREGVRLLGDNKERVRPLGDFSQLQSVHSTVVWVTERAPNVKSWLVGV